MPGKEAHDRLKAVIEAAIYITDEPLDCGTNCRRRGAANRTGSLVFWNCWSRNRGGFDEASPSGQRSGWATSCPTKPAHHEDIRKFVKRLHVLLKAVAGLGWKSAGGDCLQTAISGWGGSGYSRRPGGRCPEDAALLVADSMVGRENVPGSSTTNKTTREIRGPVRFQTHWRNCPTLKEFEALGRLLLSLWRRGNARQPVTNCEACPKWRLAALRGPEAGEFGFRR